MIEYTALISTKNVKCQEFSEHLTFTRFAGSAQLMHLCSIIVECGHCKFQSQLNGFDNLNSKQ